MTDSTTSKSLKELFLAALEVPPAERVAWLEGQCAEDTGLRRQLDDMLAAHEAPHSLLDQTAMTGAATVDQPTPAGGQPASAKPGTQIGPYKLREQIGEGGMGVVYVAEQVQPVRRKVALKIIRPGMATKEVLARFEAERQALAMMDHPHIARVFDGGETDRGQPFFVMELVQGKPITEYCDHRRIGTHGRLHIFLQVCRAVQHAHQKGIIHRDLKPSNVIVSQIDGAAVAKVIDFGVAKAVSQKLTDQTVYTQFAQMLGTPLYMSPEQFELGVVDIDTRADIYSLGVLLYELLTDRTPFDRDTFMKASHEELIRIIREVDPPRPSAAISTLQAQALSTLAERRDCDSRKLLDQVKGELDWIVMKAIEKDRSRRYQSAHELGEDVRRYLVGDVVGACPPSVGYRFKQKWRRHRGVLIPGLLILASLLTGTTVAVVKAIEADRERNLAVQSQREAAESADVALEGIATMVDAFVSQRWIPQLTGNQKRLVTDSLRLFDRLHALDPGRAEIFLLRGQVHFALNQSADAITELEKAIELDPNLAEAHLRLATNYLSNQDHQYRDQSKAWEHIQRAVEISPDDLDILLEHARIQARIARPVAEEKFARLAERFPSSSLMYSTWADVQEFIGGAARFERMRELARRAVELDETNPEAYRHLGRAHRELGNPREAISALKTAKTLAPTHHYIFRELGITYYKLGRFEEAFEEFAQGRRLAPQYWMYPRNMAWCVLQQGQYAKATELLRESMIEDEGWYNMWASVSMFRDAPEEDQLRFLQLFDEFAGEPAFKPQLYKNFAMQHLGQKQAAIAAFDQLQVPDDLSGYDAYLYTLLSAYTGMHDRYRHICVSLFSSEPTSNSEDSNSRDLEIWSCCLLPEAVRDYASVIESARRLDLNAGGPRYSHILGAILFRAGSYKEAQVHLRKAAEGSSYRSYSLYFLAMNAFRLGNPKEANRVLNAAIEESEQELAAGYLPPSLNRRITVELLRSEAEALLRDSAD